MTNQRQPPEEQGIRLEIPAQLPYIHILSRCACALLEQVENLAEPEVTLYNLELAIQEIGVNIATHAYAEQNGRIQMIATLDQQPTRIVIKLQDTGKAFDPDQVPAPRLGELQEHGFGLFLVHQLMDKVEYQPGANGNFWQLEKNVDGSSVQSVS